MIHKKSNKPKEAKRNRNLGREYWSAKTKKTVTAKAHEGEMQRRHMRKTRKTKYLLVSGEQRQDIILGDLRLQREYIVKYIQCSGAKRRVVKEGESRRNITKGYMFTMEGSRVQSGLS